MTFALNDQSLDQIFHSARTFNGWVDRPIDGDKVRAIYNLMKWVPTSANSSPARFVRGAYSRKPTTCRTTIWWLKGR